MAKNLTPVILVVDDDTDIVDLIVEQLETTEVAMKKAKDMTSALGIIVQGGISAVISDISMPGGTGVDLLSRVRATGRNTPFLFLTGNPKREYLLQAMPLGAFDILDKPFDIDELAAAVNGLVQLGIKLQELEALVESHNLTKEYIDLNRSINLLRINYLSQKHKSLKAAS